jgi:host factor-I protein
MNLLRTTPLRRKIRKSKRLKTLPGIFCKKGEPRSDIGGWPFLPLCSLPGQAGKRPADVEIYKSMNIPEGDIRVTDKNQLNLQDSFLNQVRQGKTGVTIYLVNGFQLRGLVTGFDNFTVIIETDGKQQLVYKHAISTIAPAQPVALD